MPTAGVALRESQAGFDPRMLPGLEAWFDAYAVNGLLAPAPADGDALAQWSDLSGKARHAVQSTAASQPFYRTAQPAARVANRFINPRVATAATAWNSNSGSLYPIAWDNTVGMSAATTTSAKTIRSASSPSTVIGSIYLGSTIYTNANAIPASPGEALHVAIKIKCSVAAKIYMYFNARDSSGATISVAGVAPVSTLYDTRQVGSAWYSDGYSNVASVPTVPANTVKTAHLITGPLPAGTVCVTPTAQVATSDGVAFTVGGETVNVGEALVELWPSQSGGSFVAGSVPGYSWAGAADASATVRPIATPAGVQFDGLDDRIGHATVLDPVNPATPLTVYSVFSYYGPNFAVNNNQRIFLVGGNNGAAPRFMHMTSGGAFYGVYGSITGASTGYTTNVTYVGFGDSDGADVTRTSINGVAPNSRTGSGAASLQNIFTIGNHPNGGSSSFFGQLAAALIYNRQHDLATRRRVQEWLAKRNNLALARAA